MSVKIFHNQFQSESNPVASPHLVILMPMTWSVRNVITSGMLTRLQAQSIRVTLLMPRKEKAAAGENSLHDLSRPLLHPRCLRPVRGYTFVSRLRQSAFRRIAKTHKQYRKWAGVETTLPTKLREILIETLSLFCLVPPISRYVHRVWETLYRQTYDLQTIEEQLRELKPTLLYSTVCVDPSEFPYVFVAKDLGIPVVTSILSFDNLTSRGELPHFQHYLVWNQRMRKELQTLYPTVPETQITITGTPQFDFHRRSEFLWSREATLQVLGVPAQERYLLYAANSARWTPTEPNLLAELADRMQQDAALCALWIVIRLHPLDDPRRWEELLQSGRKIKLSLSGMTAALQDDDLAKSAEHQKLLVSTLAHCEVCLNMCSTMTLDAAILDRPVIGIGFASVPGSREDKIYRAVYRSIHYRPIAESEAMTLAFGWEELLDQIHQALQNPHAARKERAALVAQECGVVDGHAAERIVSQLLTLMRPHQNGL